MEYSDGENGSDCDLVDDILGPEDLFNDEADEDGDDRHSDDEAKESEDKAVEEGKASKEKVEKKVRQPRVVKNPRVTLNFDSLKGNNGLSALKNLFKNFKFKGNGHEKEDLTRIMEVLQQWMCYQLCPSYNFESCLLQLEALGKKKVVQTLMKKYRLGMDEWGENKSDVENNADVDNNTEVTEQIHKSEFDLLLDEEIANAISDDELSQPEIVPTQNHQQTLHVEQEVTLTPEQLERIARNRKLAEERRLKRMSAQCEPMDVSQQQDQTGVREISLEQIQLDEKS